MPSFEEFVNTPSQDDELPSAGENVGENWFWDGGNAPILTLNGNAHDDGADGPSQILDAPGLRCETKRLYRDERGLRIDWVEEMHGNFKAALQYEEAWAESALLLRTRIVEGQQPLHSIVVHSPLLKATLKHVFAGYPGIFVGTRPLIFEAPLMPFVHRWDEFLRAVDGDQNSDTARHLQLLRSALEPELQVAFNTICDFEAHGAIEFNQLG